MVDILCSLFQGLQVQAQARHDLFKQVPRPAQAAAGSGGEMSERYIHGPHGSSMDRQTEGPVTINAVDRLNEQHREIEALKANQAPEWRPIAEFEEPERKARYNVLTHLGTVSVALFIPDSLRGKWDFHMRCLGIGDVIAFMPAPDPSTFKPVVEEPPPRKDLLKKSLTDFQKLARATVADSQEILTLLEDPQPSRDGTIREVIALLERELG